MPTISSSIKKPGLLFERFNDPDFRKYRVGSHILFWVCYLIYQGPIWSMVDGKYGERIISSVVELPILIGATYFTLYILIDRLLIQRKYFLFLTSFVVSVLVFGILLRSVSYFFLYPIFYPDGTLVPLLYFPKVLIAIFSIYSVVAIVASLHLVRHWHNHQLNAQELEKQKLEAELKLLKSQINPHFLFNTLNSLYVLTLNQAKAAPEVVHKLSELMSYMLYDSNQPEVSLAQELKYIENYIALERMRYGPGLDVSFHVYDSVEEIMIAPLLILPFVENCFKHGVSRQLHQPWVRIEIAVPDDCLVVKIENSKYPDAQDPRPLSGIGLQNIRKRLELIYKDQYQLQLIDEVESYLVIFKLMLPQAAVIKRKQRTYLSPVHV